MLGIGRRISTAQDLLYELEHLAKCEDRTIQNVDVSATSRTVVGQLISRADRAGVRVELLAEPAAQSNTISSILQVLLYSLLAQAISATTSGQSVKFSVTANDDHVLVSIEDGGPIVPESAFTALQKGVGVPQSLGRPAGLAWLVAGACAEKLGAQLNLGISESLRSEVRVVLHRVY